MTRQPRKGARQGRPPQVCDPVDVVDGIPDRSSRPRAWKVALLVLIFVGWVCFLVYCATAGAPAAK
jgi:hypothetical protein